MGLLLNLDNYDFCSDSRGIAIMFDKYPKTIELLDKFNIDNNSNLTTKTIKIAYIGKELKYEEKILLLKFFDELDFKIKIGENIELLKFKFQKEIYYLMNDLISFSEEEKEKIGNLKNSIEEFISQVKLNITNLIEKEEEKVKEVLLTKQQQRLYDGISLMNSEKQKKLFLSILDVIKDPKNSLIKKIDKEIHYSFSQSLLIKFLDGYAYELNGLFNENIKLPDDLLKNLSFISKLLSHQKVLNLWETIDSLNKEIEPEIKEPELSSILLDNLPKLQKEYEKEQKQEIDNLNSYLSLMTLDEQKIFFNEIAKIILKPENQLLKRFNVEPYVALTDFFFNYSHNWNHKNIFTKLFNRNKIINLNYAEINSIIMSVLLIPKNKSIINPFNIINSINNNSGLDKLNKELKLLLSLEYTLPDSKETDNGELTKTLVVVADSKKEKNQELEQICGDWYSQLENIDESLKKPIISTLKRLVGEPKENFLISIIERLENGISNDEIIKFLLNLDYFLDFLVELKLLILPEELFSKNLSREHINYLHYNFANGNKIKLDENKHKDFIISSLKYAQTGDKKELENIKNCRYIFDADECSTFIFENGDKQHLEDLLSIFHWYIDKITSEVDFKFSSTNRKDKVKVKNLGTGGYSSKLNTLLRSLKNQITENNLNINWSLLFSDFDFSLCKGCDINLNSIYSTSKFNENYMFFAGIKVLPKIVEDINKNITGKANIESLIDAYEKAINNISVTLERKLSKLKNSINK